MLEEEANVSRPRFKLFNFQRGTENYRIMQNIANEAASPPAAAASAFAEEPDGEKGGHVDKRRIAYEYKCLVVEDQQLTE